MATSFVQYRSGPLRLPFVSKTEKKEIGGRRFQNDEEVKKAVENFINGLGAEFYFTVFEKLMMRAENAYVEVGISEIGNCLKQ